jgi:hypothetical protein
MKTKLARALFVASLLTLAVEQAEANTYTYALDETETVGRGRSLCAAAMSA